MMENDQENMNISETSDGKTDMNLSGLAESMQFLTLGSSSMSDQRKFDVKAWSTPLKSIENIRRSTNSVNQPYRELNYVKSEPKPSSTESTFDEIAFAREFKGCDDSLNNISDLLPSENIFEKTSDFIEYCLTSPGKSVNILQDCDSRLCYESVSQATEEFTNSPDISTSNELTLGLESDISQSSRNLSNKLELTRKSTSLTESFACNLQLPHIEQCRDQQKDESSINKPKVDNSEEDPSFYKIDCEHSQTSFVERSQLTDVKADFQAVHDELNCKSGEGNLVKSAHCKVNPINFNFTCENLQKVESNTCNHDVFKISGSSLESSLLETNSCSSPYFSDEQKEISGANVSSSPYENEELQTCLENSCCDNALVEKCSLISVCDNDSKMIIGAGDDEILTGSIAPKNHDAVKANVSSHLTEQNETEIAFVFPCTNDHPKNNDEKNDSLAEEMGFLRMSPKENVWNASSLLNEVQADASTNISKLDEEKEQASEHGAVNDFSKTLLSINLDETSSSTNELESCPESQIAIQDILSPSSPIFSSKCEEVKSLKSESETDSESNQVSEQTYFSNESLSLEEEYTISVKNESLYEEYRQMLTDDLLNTSDHILFSTDAEKVVCLDENEIEKQIFMNDIPNSTNISRDELNSQECATISCSKVETVAENVQNVFTVILSSKSQEINFSADVIPRETQSSLEHNISNTAVNASWSIQPEEGNSVGNNLTRHTSVEDDIATVFYTSSFTESELPLAPSEPNKSLTSEEQLISVKCEQTLACTELTTEVAPEITTLSVEPEAAVAQGKAETALQLTELQPASVPEFAGEPLPSAELGEAVISVESEKESISEEETSFEPETVFSAIESDTEIKQSALKTNFELETSVECETTLALTESELVADTVNLEEASTIIEPNVSLISAEPEIALPLTEPEEADHGEYSSRCGFRIEGGSDSCISNNEVTDRSEAEKVIPHEINVWCANTSHLFECGNEFAPPKPIELSKCQNIENCACIPDENGSSNSFCHVSEVNIFPKHETSSSVSDSLPEAEDRASIMSDESYEDCAEAHVPTSIVLEANQTLELQYSRPQSARSSDDEHSFASASSNNIDIGDEEENEIAECQVAGDDSLSSSPEATIVFADPCKNDGQCSGDSPLVSSVTSSNPSPKMATDDEMNAGICIILPEHEAVEVTPADSLPESKPTEPSLLNFETPVKKMEKPDGEDLKSVKLARVCDSMNKLMLLCTPMSVRKTESRTPINPFRCEKVGDDCQKIVFDFPTNLLDVSIGVLERMTAVMAPAELPNEKLRGSDENVALDLVSVAQTPTKVPTLSKQSKSCSSSDKEGEKLDVSPARTRLLAENARLLAENTRLLAENARLLTENARLLIENADVRNELEEYKKKLRAEYESLLKTATSIYTNEGILKKTLLEYEDEVRKVNNKYEILKEYANNLVISMNNALGQCENELIMKTKELEDLKTLK